MDCMDRDDMVMKGLDYIRYDFVPYERGRYGISHKTLRVGTVAWQA